MKDYDTEEQFNQFVKAVYGNRKPTDSQRKQLYRAFLGGAITLYHECIIKFLNKNDANAEEAAEHMMRVHNNLLISSAESFGGVNKEEATRRIAEDRDKFCSDMIKSLNLNKHKPSATNTPSTGGGGEGIKIPNSIKNMVDEMPPKVRQALVKGLEKVKDRANLDSAAGISAGGKADALINHIKKTAEAEGLSLGDTIKENNISAYNIKTVTKELRCSIPSPYAVLLAGVGDSRDCDLAAAFMEEYENTRDKNK